MTPITVQFLHQHKDKVIYEKPILIGTQTIERDDYGRFSVQFDIPIFLLEKSFIDRWVNSSSPRRITSRVLRFTTNNGTILYSLPKRPLEARLWIDSAGCLQADIKFEATKEEISELAKIFSIGFA